MTTTIPHQLCREWNLKPGDPVVTYQIDGLWVLVPLAYLGVIGEPKLVQHLSKFKPVPTL
jgi:hypothetical protein